MLYSLLCKKEINQLPSCCAIFSFMQKQTLVMQADRMKLVLRDLTLRTCTTQQGHKYPGGEITRWCCVRIKGCTGVYWGPFAYDDAGHVKSRYSITYARKGKRRYI
jgi:hypothetical protein